jgi:tetratricopeptide (TPR) repeat protein
LVRHVQVKVGDDLYVLSECAALLAELGAAGEAESLYTRIIELNDWAGYLRNRAGFYIRQGRYAKAEADIARVAEKEPWHPNTHGRRGQLALVQGQFTEAQAAFQEAARRDPHNVLWQYDLAFARLGLGQTEPAMAALEEALARTELHEDVGRALQGLALLQRAQPDLPGLAVVRGRILERKALLDRLTEEECAA